MNALKDGINKFVLNEQLWRGFMGGNVKMSITIRKEKKKEGLPCQDKYIVFKFSNFRWHGVPCIDNSWNKKRSIQFSIAFLVV